MKNRKKTIKVTAKKMTVARSPVVTDYDKDFSKWANNQAKFLKNKEFAKLDMDNLIEEIEDLSKREKQRLTSYLEILLLHMLKVKFQSDMHTASWDRSIKVASHKAHKTLEENPSLKSKLKEILDDAYFSARLTAANETGLEEKTFPKKSPWSINDLFPKLPTKYC